MEGNAVVLVVSSYRERCQSLVGVLSNLGVESCATSNLAEAYDALSRKPVSLVFCDDCLKDGSYRSLLRSLRPRARWPRVVVTTRTGEWPEYLEAVELGAFDMIQFPYRPADVESNVVRAMSTGSQAA